MLPALLLVTAGACGEDPPGTSGADTGSGPGGTTRQSSAVPFTNWPTYHRNGARTGLTAPAVRPPLQQTWQDQLRGAVYGEPLVLGSSLVVATERNDVFGLDARTGKHRWRAHLGSPAPLNSLPCGNIDPLGITGTPAYDRATGSVFVVAETVGGHHTLWALNATTGARKWHRRLDVLPERNQLAQQERSALLVTGGRVITTFGGLAGDCDNYVGYVTSIATTGAGPVRHYAVPTAREAGMWSPAGPVVGANGNVYVSSGNGAELHGVWDKSDSVTELTPTLLRRLAIFAPSTWRDDNVRDLDLGSSSPAPVAAAGRIVIAGKRGTVYLLRPELGGVGSEVAHLDGCTAFGGAAVAGSVVLMPCLGEGSVRALVVGSRSLRWSWTADVYASPVIAGKLAYVADRDSGDLVVLSLATGEELDRIHAGELTHFPSQVVDGGMVFVPTLTGVTAFTGS
jgi:outer membrane protein assembly factor BamB